MSIVPKPTEFRTIVTEEVTLMNGSKKTKASITYKPRAWRWINRKLVVSKFLVKVVDYKENFCFRLYSFTSRGMFKTTPFREANEGIELSSERTARDKY